MKKRIVLNFFIVLVLLFASNIFLFKSGYKLINFIGYDIFINLAVMVIVYMLSFAGYVIAYKTLASSGEISDEKVSGPYLTVLFTIFILPYLYGILISYLPDFVKDNINCIFFIIILILYVRLLYIYNKISKLSVIFMLPLIVWYFFEKCM